MKKLTALEEKIYNDGERLIPGVTHNIAELIRHRSSYIFFKRVIELDLKRGLVSKPIRIVDLGCGVGHGCNTLSEISGSQVVGVDISEDCLEYAQTYYGRKNILFRQMDLIEFMATMQEFDYVVSRGVLEHIPNGIRLAVSANWKYRFLFNVPYAEPAGNVHHILLDIREEDLKKELPDGELFFEDLNGVTYDVHTKPANPNMITCISSSPDLPRIKDSINFPIPAWQPNIESSHVFMRSIIREWIGNCVGKRKVNDWEGYFK